MLSHPEGLTDNVNGKNDMMHILTQNLATEFSIFGLKFLSLSSLVLISFKKGSERHFPKKELKENLKIL